MILAPAVPALAGGDFDYYKKHGHRDRSWNKAVKSGFEAYDKQDCNLATQYLKEAVSSQCQDALVYFKLAVCTELTGSPYTAIQYYQLAQEKLTGLPSPHSYQSSIFENYGRALFKANRHQEAKPLLTRAAAIGTPSFGLLYMTGYLHAQTNDWNAAVEYFRRALNQDTSGVPPDLLARVYLEVAKAYYQHKDYKNALNLLNQTLRLEPNNQEASTLRTKIQTSQQQKSLAEMFQNLEGRMKKEDPLPKSNPPPPAAAKLPPLDGVHPVPPGQPGSTPPSNPLPPPQP